MSGGGTARRPNLCSMAWCCVPSSAWRKPSAICSPGASPRTLLNERSARLARGPPSPRASRNWIGAFASHRHGRKRFSDCHAFHYGTTIPWRGVNSSSLFPLTHFAMLRLPCRLQFQPLFPPPVVAQRFLRQFHTSFIGRRTLNTWRKRRRDAYCHTVSQRVLQPPRFEQVPAFRRMHQGKVGHANHPRRNA